MGLPVEQKTGILTRRDDAVEMNKVVRCLIILSLSISYLGDFIGTFVVTTWPGHGHGQQVLTRIRMGVFKIQVNWMNEPKNASSFIYNKYVNCLVRVLAYLQRVYKVRVFEGFM